MGSYMEIFEARVLGGKSIFTSEVYSVQSGVLPVYYSDHAAIYSILQLSMLYIKTARLLSINI
jgi:hypothetical protein